jgi:hypothetical protein
MRPKNYSKKETMLNYKIGAKGLEAIKIIIIIIIIKPVNPHWRIMNQLDSLFSFIYLRILLSKEEKLS